eukprot:1876971-Pyramimonas_sp.AAC.1
MSSEAKSPRPMSISSSPGTGIVSPPGSCCGTPGPPGTPSAGIGVEGGVLALTCAACAASSS